MDLNDTIIVRMLLDQEKNTICIRDWYFGKIKRIPWCIIWISNYDNNQNRHEVKNMCE